jgi:hypothetical protein
MSSEAFETLSTIVYDEKDRFRFRETFSDEPRGSGNGKRDYN